MSWPGPREGEQTRIAQLADRAGDLQAVPVVVTRALRCTEDPGSGTVQLAAILNTDHIIAGRLIGLANSALYFEARPFVTVREAIVRLGYRKAPDSVPILAHVAFLDFIVVAIAAGEPPKWIRIGIQVIRMAERGERYMGDLRAVIAEHPL